MISVHGILELLHSRRVAEDQEEEDSRRLLFWDSFRQDLPRAFVRQSACPSLVFKQIVSHIGGGPIFELSHPMLVCLACSVFC